MFTAFIASKFTAQNPEYLSDFDQPKGSEREDKVNIYTTKTFIDTKRISVNKCTFNTLASHGVYGCAEFADGEG